MALQSVPPSARQPPKNDTSTTPERPLCPGDAGGLAPTRARETRGAVSPWHTACPPARTHTHPGGFHGAAPAEGGASPSRRQGGSQAFFPAKTARSGEHLHPSPAWPPPPPPSWGPSYRRREAGARGAATSRPREGAGATPPTGPVLLGPPWGEGGARPPPPAPSSSPARPRAELRPYGKGGRVLFQLWLSVRGKSVS